MNNKERHVEYGRFMSELNSIFEMLGSKSLSSIYLTDFTDIYTSLQSSFFLYQ